MALSLLCFFRKSNIEKCFLVIKNHYINLYEEEQVKTFFSYFEDTWIKGNFDSYLWNYFEDDKGVQFNNIQKTNNCVESFHNQLSFLLHRLMFYLIINLLYLEKKPNSY